MGAPGSPKNLLRGHFRFAARCQTRVTPYSAPWTSMETLVAFKSS